MTTPRNTLVDSAAPRFYHLVSRCVRRSWLCGVDRRSRRNYEHRRQWLVDRLHKSLRTLALDTQQLILPHLRMTVSVVPGRATYHPEDAVHDAVAYVDLKKLKATITLITLS